VITPCRFFGARSRGEGQGPGRARPIFDAGGAGFAFLAYPCQNSSVTDETDIRAFVRERFRRTDEKLDKVVELLGGVADRLFSMER